MALQNRVLPDGAIAALPARGTMMGNRGGCFHRPDRTLGERRWASRQWICCVLEFKNRRRSVMSPGLYTELFFLDEATALAAGHRPCFECRRADALRFAELWASAHRLGHRPTAPEMDLVLHGQRLEGRSKRTWRAPIEQLPPGTMFRDGDAYFLVSKKRALRWSPDGYRQPSDDPRGGAFDVLTPQATVSVLAAGYRPNVHPTAAPFSAP